jgi:hypothetical protein
MPFIVVCKQTHYNSLALTEEGASDVVGVSMDSLYSLEFLNTLQFNSIAKARTQSGRANPFVV